MKINFIVSILYILIMVPILLAVCIFDNECWEYLIIFQKPKVCCCEVYISFYFMIIPLISAFFSSILSRVKKTLLVPSLMYAIFCLFIIIGEIRRSVLRGTLTFGILPFIVAIPTFIASLLGVEIGKLVYYTYYKLKEHIKQK